MPSTLNRGPRPPRARHRLVVLTGILVVALSSCREAQSAGTDSVREQLNRLHERRAATRPPHEDTPYPEFLSAFERIASIRVPLAPGTDGALAHRPDVCALTGGGDLYLATADRAGIRVWRAGSNTLREFRTPSGAVKAAVGDLFWQPEESVLYVLDSGREQVRRYTPQGVPAGFAPVNAGQINAGLIVLGGGRMVLGGAREDRPGHYTLVSVHDAAGRHQASFLDMGEAMARSKLRAAPPVLLARVGGDRFLAAEPSSPEILEMSTDGRVLGRMQADFDGYRRPVPLTGTTIDPMRTDAWIRSWDRLVLLHASPRYVYTAFQSWRGRRTRYTLEVLDRAGARVATGLQHDSFPICGGGDEIVVVSQGRQDQVEITRWRFRGTPGRTPARGGDG